MGRTLGVAASLLVLILLTVVAVMTMQTYNELSAADHAVVTAERELERARARQAAARPGVGDLDAQMQAALETVTDATRSYDDLRRSYPTLVIAIVAGFRERPLPDATPTRPRRDPRSEADGDPMLRMRRSALRLLSSPPLFTAVG